MDHTTHIFLRSLSCAVVGLVALVGSAKPADPRPRTVVQPDGTTVTVTLRGDEHCHYYVGDDNCLLAPLDGAFYHATVSDDGRILPTPLLAHDIAQRGTSETSFLRSVDRQALAKALDRRAVGARSRAAAPAAVTSAADVTYPGLYPWSVFPSKGSPNVLVILVDFPDEPFRIDDPYDYFERLLNQPGFSDLGGTGCVADWFSDNSCGQFTPSLDLYGPVTMPNGYAYYGSNDVWGNDLLPYEMVIHACQQLDDEVDFSKYDTDGDGLIDNVYVYYAGLGESGEGGPDTIWPHSWNVSYGTSTKYVFDGVRLERYACSNEWESGRPDGIGTFVHEFSHVMGLPDLYSTTYSQAYTPESWDVMDNGCYNNNGCTPPNYSAFERIALGWLDPVVLDSPADVDLMPIGENEACSVLTDNANEYFLLENRQKTGWDAYLPGHGMLIWHIDYDRNAWYNNAVNNEAAHQHVDLVEADGSRSGNRSGQAFPGTKKVTSFTDDTTPSMLTWSKQSLGLPIENIRENGQVISFTVAGGQVDYADLQIWLDGDVKARSLAVVWTEDPAATLYRVTVCADSQDADPSPVPIPGWDARDVGCVTSVVIDGLQPSTRYYISVVASNGYGCGAPSNVLEVFTAELTLEASIPQVLEAEDVDGTSFTARWMPVEGASGYLLSVYTKTVTEMLSQVCDFTGGVTKLPEGWSSTSSLSFASASYTGQSAPALRLGADGACISSCVYDSDVVALSFWHRGSNVPEGNTLGVTALVGDEWVDVTDCAVCCLEGGEVVTVNGFPDGARAVRITYHMTEDWGAVAIDDIEVSRAAAYVGIPLDGFDARLLDDVSCKVTGLQPASTYYYRVVATNGEVQSLSSDEMAVRTLADSGIDDLVAGGVLSVTACGSRVSVDGTGSEALVSVVDVTGRVVASARADRWGHAVLDVPSSGVMIVRVGAKAVKIRL